MNREDISAQVSSEDRADYVWDRADRVQNVDHAQSEVHAVRMPSAGSADYPASADTDSAASAD